MDQDQNDDAEKAPVEIPDNDSSEVFQSGPNAVASAPVIPVNLIPVGGPVFPLIGKNSTEIPLTIGSGFSNIISDTPSAVKFVDKDGKILPTPPPASDLVGNTVGNTIASSLLGANDGAKIGPSAVTYVDQSGRVLVHIPYPPAVPDSPLVRMVDSNGRIVTSAGQPNTAVLDKNGKIISGPNTSPGKAGIPATNAGNSHTLPSASSMVQSETEKKMKELRTYRNSVEEGNRSKSE